MLRLVIAWWNRISLFYSVENQSTQEGSAPKSDYQGASVAGNL